MNAAGEKTLGGAWNALVARNVGGTWDAPGSKEGKRLKFCFGCGREGHFAGDESCRARNQACRNCG